MEGFEPFPGGAAVRLGQAEASILRGLADQLLDLLATRGEPVEDPVAAIFAPGPTEPPADPVLARLLPDAYDDADDARERSAEFRRFTEDDLRARKRDDARALIADVDALGPGGGVLSLDAEDCRRWLGALNDLRLALAVRLEIATEEDADKLYDLPPDDERVPTVIVYSWLNMLQDSLVAAVMPPGPGDGS
ncbi:DUF2017 domain-containing protein [Glycomyces terrestris]|uniref:DUF2017 domain-containing protein n=1 Tax=Glycomyces terrestris TaxID=2493553 RepID=A0A426UVR4_9ACTN|nr:DUF2017 domain-containing protein [Glycomyces terrestris]RRR98271.1 DUF2017 domain-containing protein [Glycomyces terrestris]